MQLGKYAIPWTLLYQVLYAVTLDLSSLVYRDGMDRKQARLSKSRPNSRLLFHHTHIDTV